MSMHELTRADTPHGTWYRNAPRAGTSPRWHMARVDWIRSGRAVYGREITSPGYVIDAGRLASPPLGACKRCAAIFREGRKA